MLLETKPAKDASIETLRGVAILLVIAGYVIVDDLSHASLFSSAMSFLHHLITPVRIPLFTVISGYLYAASPVTQGTFAKLAKGKYRRILVPFLTVTLIQYFFHHFGHESAKYPLQGLPQAYVWPLQQLWFLMAVFWIFLIVGIADAHKVFGTFRKWAFWAFAAALLRIFTVLPMVLALKGVVYLMPFFLLGYGLRRYKVQLFSRTNLKVCGVLLVAGYLIHTLLYLYPLPYRALYKAVGMAISFAVSVLLIRHRRAWGPLAWIGSYAFTIHLFCQIALSVPRTVASHVPMNEPMLFSFCLICALGLPILIHQVLDRFEWSRRFILGMRKAEPKSKPQGHIFVPYPLKRSMIAMDRQYLRLRRNSRRRAALRSLQKQLIDI